MSDRSVSPTAKLWGPLGALIHASSGDVLAPLQLFAIGIAPPAANAGS